MTVISISTHQLQDKIREESPTLIDVREPDEFLICHIEGSINIPMNLLPSRLMEFEMDQNIVVICHHGVRSSIAGEFLESRGFVRLSNLFGGIDAWAREIDTKMARY